MKRKLSQNLSVNALQLIINQVLGLGIFYILSTGLDKNNFGKINLALAILLAAFNILSCGIDQVSIRKIAAGSPPGNVLSLYLCHVLITGLVFYGILFVGNFIFSTKENIYQLVLLIGIGKLMFFFSTPFKQSASGMERFNLLAYMSVISNLVRCCGLIAVAICHLLTMPAVVGIFIFGDVLEMLFCIILFRKATQVPIVIKWNWPAYIALLRESLPQVGVVLITSALARFDWIFIGFMVSAVKLAEYSFAYKVFEMATLPLLAIAPLLIPRFTKLFQQENIDTTGLKFLLKTEMIVAVLIAVLLNVCWAPVIDVVTYGKYGAINVTTIFILSLCMPLLYFNNFFWTIYFAQGRMRMIFTSFLIAFIVNVVGDLILIPFYKNEGAALAFLISCLAQSVFFLRQNTIATLGKPFMPLIICTSCGLLSGFAAKLIFPQNWLILLAAIIFYFSALFITGQLSRKDKEDLTRVLNW